MIQKMTAAEAHLRQKYKIPSNYNYVVFNDKKFSELPENQQPAAWFDYMDSIITIYNNGDCVEKHFDTEGRIRRHSWPLKEL